MPAPAPGSHPTTSAHALHAIASGDRSAWQWLCTEHATEVLAIARRILGADHAEDACHDVFVRIHANAQRFVPGDDAEEHAHAWIRRVALNVCLNLRRRVSRQRSQPLHDDAIEAGSDDQGERALAGAEVLDAIADLPEHERNLLTMRFWDGLDHRSIAHQLGCSEPAARVRLHRTIRQLRRRLSPLMCCSLAALLRDTRRVVRPPGHGLPTAQPSMPMDLATHLIRIGIPRGLTPRLSTVRLRGVAVAGLCAAAALVLAIRHGLPTNPPPAAPTDRAVPCAMPNRQTAIPTPGHPIGLADKAVAVGLRWHEDGTMRVEYASVGPTGYALGPVEQSRTLRRVTIAWKESVHPELLNGMAASIIPKRVDDAVAALLTLVNVRRSDEHVVLLLPTVPVLDIHGPDRWLCVSATELPDGRGIVVVPYHDVEDWFNGPTDHALRFITTPAHVSAYHSYWSSMMVRVDEAVRAGPPPLPCRVATR